MDKKKIVSVLAGVMAAVMLLTLLLSLFAGSVSAASSSEIKNQIKELEKEKAAIAAQIKELEAQRKENLEAIHDIVSEKDTIDQQIGLMQTEVVAITQLISAYNLLIADKQEEVDAAEQRLADLNAAYKERIRAMEEEGPVSYWAVLFEANSFFDLLDRLNMIEEIAAADQRRLEQLNEAAIAVNEAKEALSAERAALQAAKSAMELLQTALEVKQLEASELLNSLIAKGEEYDAIIESSEEMQDKLMLELAAKEDAYDKAKYSEWLATSVPPTKNPGGPGNTVDGITWYLPLPTRSYVITSPFGPRTHPITGEKGKMHNGIDMAAVTGTPIYATRAGVVTVTSFEEGGAGYYVKINHGDGFISIYMHMTHYIVKPGDFVQAGQKIGYVGSTGGSTGPHLHFGIAKNGTYVNPLKYIDA